MNIGLVIKTIREERGMSKADVYTPLDIDASQYSKIEKGEKGLTTEKLKKFCILMGVTSDSVLFYEEQKSNTKTPPKAVANEGVKMSENKGQSAISLLKEIEIKQYEILANLKKISDEAIVIQEKSGDESEYAELIKQADKLRAEWQKPGIGIRNKTPKKSEQDK